MFIYNEYNGIFRTNFPSYILNKRENNETAQWILREGIPERNLIEWTKQYTSLDLNFVDAGAHMGSYTINLGPLSKNVYSFEPSRTTFYQLCGGIALNNLDNVFAYNVALGESGTFKTLNTYSVDGGGSSLLDSVTNNRYGGNVIGKDLVEVKALDDYKIDNVGFMKIDVEGYEYQVILGARHTIERSRPAILFECWNESWFETDKNKTFDLLKSLNYNIVPINQYSNMFFAAPR
jgi:FkbM family methyltransferase